MSETVRSQYRIPKDLNEWLAARAKEESRSKNAQLVVELRVRMHSSAIGRGEGDQSPFSSFPEEKITG